METTTINEEVCQIQLDKNSETKIKRSKNTTKTQTKTQKTETIKKSNSGSATNLEKTNGI